MLVVNVCFKFVVLTFFAELSRFIPMIALVDSDVTLLKVLLTQSVLLHILVILGVVKTTRAK